MEKTMMALRGAIGRSHVHSDGGLTGVAAK